MTVVAPVQPLSETIIYPESDGKPMADNTRQFEEIVKIKGNLDALFKDNPDVFVAGDLLWYPKEGNNTLRAAPDVMVAFGRPKGHRGSYMQWLEANIAPQVAFEILSPGNTVLEMQRKLKFYERFGVEEYYVYDPDRGDLSGSLRVGDRFEEIEPMTGWVSPRLGIRFELNEETLELYYPDGRKFESYIELTTRAQQAEAEAEHARQRAIREQQRAEHAELAAVQAQQRTAEAESAANQAWQRAERLAARLRALGIDEAE